MLLSSDQKTAIHRTFQLGRAIGIEQSHADDHRVRHIGFQRLQTDIEVGQNRIRSADRHIDPGDIAGTAGIPDREGEGRRAGSHPHGEVRIVGDLGHDAIINLMP